MCESGLETVLTDCTWTSLGWALGGIYAETSPTGWCLIMGNFCSFLAASKAQNCQEQVQPDHGEFTAEFQPCLPPESIGALTLTSLQKRKEEHLSHQGKKNSSRIWMCALDITYSLTIWAIGYHIPLINRVFWFGTLDWSETCNFLLVR